MKTSKKEQPFRKGDLKRTASQTVEVKGAEQAKEDARASFDTFEKFEVLNKIAADILCDGGAELLIHFSAVWVGESAEHLHNKSSKRKAAKASELLWQLLDKYSEDWKQHCLDAERFEQIKTKVEDGQPVNEKLFEEVGEEHSVGLDECRNSYYEFIKKGLNNPVRQKNPKPDSDVKEAEEYLTERIKLILKKLKF